MKKIPLYICLTLAILLCTATLTCGKGGRGGGSRGGSRGSSSRGSSSRGSSSSSSSSSSSRSSHLDRKTSNGDRSSSSSAQVPPPKKQEPSVSHTPYKPPARVQPSAPRLEPSAPNAPVRNPNPNVHNPPYNPSYPDSNIPNRNAPYPNQGQPPPYPGSAQRPPPSYPGVNQAPPPYSGPGQGRPAYNPAEPPPPYPGLGQPGNVGQAPPPYPRQPNSGSVPYPQQPGTVNRPYPQQPNPGGAPYPQQPGTVNRPYPQQPSSGGAPYPQQPGMPNRPYPQQPGFNGPYGAAASFGNPYVKPYKRKGVLGSLFSGGKSSSKTPKHYGSVGGVHSYYPGKSSGIPKAMYPIIPLMAMKKSKNLFKPRFGFSSMGYYPRFGFMPMYMPHYHHYHHHHGWQSSSYYDINNEDYAGICRKPMTPAHSRIGCITTEKAVKCEIQCLADYRFPDNTTSKSNECWHIGGVWRPKRNFESCQPVCNETCQNGGKCTAPNVCACDPEYRGPHCEYHILKCDVRKLAGPNANKIGWVCKHTRNETTCNIKCKEPGHFNGTPAETYHCSLSGEWTPNSIPDCVTEEKKKGTETE